MAETLHTMEELIKLAEGRNDGPQKVKLKIDRMVKNGMDRDMAVNVLYRLYQNKFY